MQKKILAGLMIIVMFGFSGQYLVNLASADNSWSDIQKAAAVSQARALQKYENTHAWPLDQSTKYAGSKSTSTNENVIIDRNVNIANGRVYSQAKGISIFDQIHALGFDKFSTKYAGLAKTPVVDTTVHKMYTLNMDRNTAIALARAQMDKNNIKIIQALASIQPKYVGIDNTQTTDSNGRDRNVMIQQGIATLEQQNVDLAAQLASLTTNYVKLDNSVSTDVNGRDRQAYIVKALADSEAGALAILEQMNVVTGQRYVGIDNTQTTDSNGRDRNVMIQQGIEAVNLKIADCYTAENPKVCNIGSGANYTQYAP